MTFLPIIDRELRVRARGQALYWTRGAAAVVGLLACLYYLLEPSPFLSQMAIGARLFAALVNTAFVLSCCGCLLTAEAISAEKQQGTLGLLLLTRVRVIDLLLGKLGSVGLSCLGVLAGFLPVLAVPLLLGGVTGGELLRKSLALFNALFLSLAVGLWTAASEADRFKAARNAAAVFASLGLVPFAIGASCASANLVWSLWSPLFAFVKAGAAAYPSFVRSYWVSLVLVQVMTWLFLVDAVKRLRRTVRAEGLDQPSPEPPPGPTPRVATRSLWRPHMVGDAGPFQWRVCRQRGLRAALWVAALLGTSHQISLHLGLPWYARLFGPGVLRSTWVLAQAPLLAISVLQSVLIAWAASRFFLEARRNGELEVILTTPLGARTIVTDQWTALKRLLWGPMLLLLLPCLLPILLPLASPPLLGKVDLWLALRVVSTFLSLANTLLGVAALCWLALWFGAHARGAASAITWTVGLGEGLPRLLDLGWGVILTLFLGPVGPASFSLLPALLWCLPQAAFLLLFVGLIQWAKRRLQHRWAPPLPLTLRQWFSAEFRDLGRAVHQVRRWTPS